MPQRSRIAAARDVRSLDSVALRKIIVGCDGEPGSRDALRFASMLARIERSELILANVYRHDSDAALELVTRVERTVPYGIRASMRVLVGTSPAHCLRDLADSEGADLIVIGQRRSGRGQSPFVTGFHCPVAVAPSGFADDPDPGLRVIGVAFDGSPEADAALTVAADLALAAHASIRLIGVAQAPRRPSVGMAAVYVPDMEGDYRSLLLGELESAADELPLSLRTQVVLADGDPGAALIDRAAPLSLLVMGSHGRGAVGRALLGSVSAEVVRAMPCPLLVVPQASGVQRAAA